MGRRKEEGGIVSWAKVLRALPPSLVIPSPRASLAPPVYLTDSRFLIFSKNPRRSVPWRPHLLAELEIG